MTRSAKVGEDVKLAPLIGIDGATEGKIRRIVVADDAAALISVTSVRGALAANAASQSL